MDEHQKIHFDWDANKARSNARKHKVTFDEATTVFGNQYALTFHDPDHSEDEERFITIGQSPRGLLIVSHTIEDDGSVRIISARKPTRTERKIYEEG